MSCSVKGTLESLARRAMVCLDAPHELRSHRHRPSRGVRLRARAHARLLLPRHPVRCRLRRAGPGDDARRRCWWRGTRTRSVAPRMSRRTRSLRTAAPTAPSTAVRSRAGSPRTSRSRSSRRCARASASRRCGRQTPASTGSSRFPPSRRSSCWCAPADELRAARARQLGLAGARSDRRLPGDQASDLLCRPGAGAGGADRRDARPPRLPRPQRAGMAAVIRGREPGHPRAPDAAAARAADGRQRRAVRLRRQG